MMSKRIKRPFIYEMMFGILLSNGIILLKIRLGGNLSMPWILSRQISRRDLGDTTKKTKLNFIVTASVQRKKPWIGMKNPKLEACYQKMNMITFISNYLLYPEK